jgi:hypothetical protein
VGLTAYGDLSKPGNTAEGHAMMQQAWLMMGEVHRNAGERLGHRIEKRSKK